jgi:hypothetical protein
MKFELKTLEEYSDEALLNELRHVADLLQGERLTRKRFNSKARVHSTTLSNRFGSWVAALDKAGISETIAPRFKVLAKDSVLQSLREFITENPGQSVTEEVIAARLGLYRGSIIRRFGKWEGLLAEVGLAPVPLGRRYTDEECLENILALWTHYGRQPHFEELRHPPSNVGPKAYIRRWGGWRAALSAFVKQVNEPSASPIELNSHNSGSINQKDAVQSAPAPRSMSLTLR